MEEQKQLAKQTDQSVKTKLFSGVKSFFTKGKNKNDKGRGRAQTELDIMPPKFDQQPGEDIDMPKKKLPKNFA